MKLLVLRECFVDDGTGPQVRMVAGDTIDIADRYARKAILRGLAQPFVSEDDAESGAPPRTKAAMTGAPEQH